MRKAILLGLILAMWFLGGFNRAYSESVIHDTSAEFNGTFSNTEKTGNPAVKIVYNVLPWTASNSFGDGHNSSPTVSGTINTYASCSGSSGSTTLTTGLSVSGGDIILIHQTRGTGAGQWELNKVVSDNGSTLTLYTALTNSYTTGAQAVKVPQYTGGTISGAITGTAWNGSVGGIIALMSNGDLTISGSLSANSLGYRGATVQGTAKTGGKQGEGTNYNQTRSPSANGNGAGGGNFSDGVGTSGGGGGSNGGAGEAGHTSSAVTPGQPGSVVGNATLTNIMFGGGGGGGCCGNSSGESGGAGGVGAGLIFVFAKNYVVSGSNTATGGNGSVGAGEAAGGSGAGGSILIKCQTAILGTNKVTASGGARISDNHYGGAGGVGRIRVEYGTRTGTTSPTYSGATLTYKTSGTYLSGAVSIAGCTSFGNLNWTASGGTSVKFRTRTASTAGGLSSATWSGDLTTSGSQITSSANEYIQYEVSFVGTTSDSPTLNSVSINYQTNNPPTDPSNPSPSDGAYTNDDTPLCSWSASTDADEDPITYYFTLSANSDLSDPIVDDASTGTDTQYQCSLLSSDGTYYWQVKAGDTKDYNENPATWSFTLDKQDPVVPVITSIHPDFATGKITKIYGTGENGTTLTFKDENNNPIAGTVEWDGDNFTFTPTIPLDPGSSVYVVSEDDAENTSQSNTGVISFEYLENIFKDETVYYGVGPGNSMRMEKDTYYEFNIAVNDGEDPDPDEPVTVMLWLRKNSDYSGTQPSVTLTELGIDGTGAATDSMTVGADTWEQLTVTGTPNAKGVVTLKVETFSTVDGAKAWIDDISVSQ